MKTRLSHRFQKMNFPRMTHTHVCTKWRSHKNREHKDLCLSASCCPWKRVFPSHIHWLFTQMHTQTHSYWCYPSRRHRSAPDGAVNMRPNWPPGCDWFGQMKGKKKTNSKEIHWKGLNQNMWYHQLYHQSGSEPWSHYKVESGKEANMFVQVRPA